MPPIDKLVVTPGARADLVEIARFTRDKWGPKQQEVYLSGLYKLLDQIVAWPRIGRAAPKEMGRGISWRLYREHFIYYRQRGQQVHILRIILAVRDQATAYRR